MAETPPFLKSQNADTKPASAQQQTALRQSDYNVVDLFAHSAGGEADASPSLFCLISISALRRFVNKFFPLLNIFRHSGKNNACTGGGGSFRLGPQPNCRISKGGVPSCLRTIRIRSRTVRTSRISRTRSRSATRRKTASDASLFEKRGGSFPPRFSMVRGTPGAFPAGAPGIRLSIAAVVAAAQRKPSKTGNPS